MSRVASHLPVCLAVTHINNQMSDQESRKDSFFRQSGWLMFATVIGGSMMWAVHFLSKAIPEREYGDFGVFLAVVMVLPAIPLQMVFAQQTAKALAEGRPGQVSSLVRVIVLGTTVLWALAAIMVLVFQGQILAQWKVSNHLALWLTLPVVLFSMVLPMFWGVLQGAQSFLWLGWSLMLNSAGRVVAAAFAVLVVGAYAPGMLFGVLFGLLTGLAIALYHTRQYWFAKPAPFEWQIFTRQVTPLLLGFIGFQILFTADTMFVKAYFSQEQAGYYISAGTLSRALMWLVLPLASVMFPKLVRSSVRSQKTNLTGLVLLGTAVLSIGGAIGLAIFGPFVIRLVYKASYVGVATSLLPWYASVMIPLALGNVLLNQLMARPASRMGLSLGILAISIGYMYALSQYHAQLSDVLKVMGIFNLIFLALCGLVVWRDKVQEQ
jgi:O-antigen/teichoic acid export membrane protein